MELVGPTDGGGHCPEDSSISTDEENCCCGIDSCCWGECRSETPPKSCLENLPFEAEWRPKEDCADQISRGMNTTSPNLTLRSSFVSSGSSRSSQCFHAIQKKLGKFKSAFFYRVTETTHGAHNKRIGNNLY